MPAGPRAVILSNAKDLHFALQRQVQVLHFVQDDSAASKAACCS
jgi:hypothetical protein